MGLLYLLATPALVSSFLAIQTLLEANEEQTAYIHKIENEKVNCIVERIDQWTYYLILALPSGLSWHIYLFPATSVSRS